MFMMLTNNICSESSLMCQNINAEFTFFLETIWLHSVVMQWIHIAMWSLTYNCSILDRSCSEYILLCDHLLTIAQYLTGHAVMVQGKGADTITGNHNDCLIFININTPNKWNIKVTITWIMPWNLFNYSWFSLFSVCL